MSAGISLMYKNSGGCDKDNICGKCGYLETNKTKAGAFYYCRSLESVFVPSLINSVDDFLCFGCLSLKKVSLPDGLVSIGEYAFFGCAALEGLSFPEGVSVAETSFEGSGVKK